MAAFELTIKAMSLADLEEATIALGDRFRPIQGDPSQSAGEGAGGPEAGGAPAPVRTRGRPRGSRVQISASTHPATAGEAQTYAGSASTGLQNQGHMGAAAGGGDDGGAVEPAGQGQDQVEAGDTAASSDEVAEEAQTETKVGPSDQTGQEADTVDAGTPAVDAPATTPDLPGDAGGAAALGDGEAEVTIETVKAAAAELIGKKGFPACKAVFAEHSISKPSDTPPEKFGVVLAGLQKAMG